MPPDSRVHVGVAAVVKRDGHLLMLQRGGASGYAVDGVGRWSVPGGWIDLGETPREAAEREVLEETGVVVAADDDAGFTCNWRESGVEQIITLFVLCRWLKGEPSVIEPDKCPVVEWTPVADVAARPLFAPLESWWPGHDR